MKRCAILFTVLSAACSGPSSSTHGSALPGATRSTDGPVSAPCDCAEPPDVKVAARRGEVQVEIERIDRELDAIDGELAAAAQHNGRTLVQARVDALAYKASLDAISADVPAVGANAPRMLVRPVRELGRALAEQAQLRTELGPAHPEMKRQVRRIEHLRRTVTVQLAAEQAFVQAWIDLLAALPAKAKSDEIYKARLRALRATLAKAPPSSPVTVQMAVERLDRLALTLAELDGVGPKHPEMIRVTAQIEEATQAKASALAEADADLATRIGASTRLPDGAVIARRSELADRARELRQEYELLVAR